jgi:hypothetical protein
MILIDITVGQINGTFMHSVDGHDWRMLDSDTRIDGTGVLHAAPARLPARVAITAYFIESFIVSYVG